MSLSTYFLPNINTAVCPELSIRGGTVSYSNRFFIGSVGTHRCNDLCAVNGGATASRTCTESGWTGFNLTCECKSIALLQDYKQLQ